MAANGREPVVSRSLVLRLTECVTQVDNKQYTKIIYKYIYKNTIYYNI